MPQSRRSLLSTLVGAAGVLVAKPLFLPGLSMQRTPQPIPSPHAPNPNFPPGMDGPGIGPQSDKKNVDPKKQEQIRTDIQKLYELAADLRDQAAKADLNSTLPVSVVKQAQQIEKLAKQIKDLSKG
jgi:hypothetical protein